MKALIYLYVKTHNTTGLKYFGKTIQDPFKYKGSGTRWVLHIKKHGYDVSTEIIGKYLDLNECKNVALKFSRENDIVNSSKWANLKEEDISGGFDHINVLPKEDRINLIALKQKIQSGEISCGGTKNWTEESYKKVKTQALLNLKNMKPKFNVKMSEEQKLNISKKVSGKNNGNYGNVWCVKIDAVNTKDRKPHKKDNIPEGWISCIDWKDLRKNKSKSAYGKHWYNDGIKNYYLYSNDNKVIELNLEKRRLISK